jgi:60 kDa SS-A/Ro ribonucleoprotein
MRMNTAAVWPTPRTAEGAVAARIGPEPQLRRLVAACMLWENGFYETGVSVAERIKALVPECRPSFVAACAYEARTKMKLRHVPLLLVREMARHDTHTYLVADLLRDVIQRADELAEFLAIYFGGNDRRKSQDRKLSGQVKKGLAAAFQKFDAFQLAKYNRPDGVKLRDALFLCHAKPKDEVQAAVWKQLVDGTLPAPDTWEVALSAGANKAETFTRLMAGKQLGALAFLRNLRGMKEAGVPVTKVEEYAVSVDISRVLPFRFIAAARAVPAWENVIEPMMLRACEGREKIAGHTIVLLDVSGSMSSQVSGKSDITRLDAACGVAILLRELCEQVSIFTFSDQVKQVPPRHGFALRDAIGGPRGGTRLRAAVDSLAAIPRQRIVVLTDEQSADGISAPGGLGYVINVAANQNGVGYGPWTHIDGWSEACIDFIQESERLAS